MTGTNCPSAAAWTSATMSSAGIPVAAPSAAASAGRSVTWAVSTPTLTTSVGVNSGAPGGVGDRGPLGQGAGELEVLPLPQLRVHQGRLGHDLPLVVALASLSVAA